MNQNEDLNAVVDQEVYEKMLHSAIELHREIRYKHDNDFTVTEAEANFTNDFLAYVQELNKVLEKQVED